MASIGFLLVAIGGRLKWKEKRAKMRSEKIKSPKI